MIVPLYIGRKGTFGNRPEDSRGFHVIDGKNRKIDLKKRLSRLKEGKTTDFLCK